MQTDVVLSSIPLADLVSKIAEAVRREQSEKQQKADDLMTTEEVMHLFKVTETTLMNWRKAGKIPFTKIQRKIFYRRSEVMKLVS